MNGRAENCPDDLVLLCAESGDDALAKRLYSEVHGRVRYSTLGRSLGESSTDAEHEAVAKMLTSEGRPNLVVAILGSPVRSALCVAWVRRAARNRAIDILRSAGFRNTLYGDAPESDHPVTSRKPTDWGETQLDAMTVRAGMVKLRQTDRELLTLYFIEECDYDDLSRILNKPVGNLRVAVSRAIGRLGRLLREPGTARREDAPTK
jgi:RNA polymerase sigma factor (sigma-70 family)